jgi:2-polyprenyl-3-methyl-5-hydroxy-6-metoxy-1,4-benzoquinol methylase
MRECQICLSDEIEELYNQNFLTIGDDNISSYAISICRACGFAFANNLPSQNEYIEYYSQNDKYTYTAAKNGIPEGLKRLHTEGYTVIDKYIQEKDKNKSDVRILDVGCATGHFLNIFKSHGYIHVTGVDLNPVYALVAKEDHDIEVILKPLEEIEFQNKYDVIILSGVLEHIADLRSFIKNIARLLENDGLIFAEQPDLALFSKNVVEPFLEFSVEHINYFTVKSLANLFSASGLRIIYSENKKTYLNSYDFIALAIKDDAELSIEAERDSKILVKEYIDNSLAQLLPLEKKFHEWKMSNKKIIVWGTGSFLMRLLATTELRDANIVQFIDKNINMQGKSILGIKIDAPEKILKDETTLFIASSVYGKEIKDQLQKEINFKGEIFTV